MITQLAEVEVFLSNTRAQRHDQRLDLAVTQHLVEPGFLYIQYLSLERENCLILPVATLFGRAARGITLDNVDFRKSGISLLAIGQLSRKHSRSECAFPDNLPRLARSFARSRGIERFTHDLPGHGRILLQILR